MPQHAPSATFAWVTFAFVKVNLAFFMPVFFFISGYFTPASLRKKGLHGFLRDRFYRLGIPCLVTLFVLNPFLTVYVSGFRLNVNQPFPSNGSVADLSHYLSASLGSKTVLTPLSLKYDSLLAFLVDYLVSVTVGFGIMWYAAWLLLLSFIYAYVNEWKEDGVYVEMVHDRMPKFRWVLIGSFCMGLGSAVFKYLDTDFLFFQQPLLPVSVVHNVGCFLFGCHLFNRFEGHDFVKCFKGWMDLGVRRVVLQLSFVGLITCLFANISGQFHEFQEVGRACATFGDPSRFGEDVSSPVPFANKLEVYTYWKDVLALRGKMPRSCEVQIDTTTFMVYMSWCQLVFAGFFLPISAYVLLDFCITLDRLRPSYDHGQAQNYAFSLSILDDIKRQTRYMYGVYIFHPIVITLTGVLLMWLYEVQCDTLVQILTAPSQHLGTMNMIDQGQASVLPIHLRFAGWALCCVCPLVICIGITKFVIKYVPSADQIL